MRLIDADVLIEYFNNQKVKTVSANDIARFPTIDAAPVKNGKWFDAMVGELPVQVCDQCNTFFPLAYTGGGHHYCPNCGTKMDLEDEQ